MKYIYISTDIYLFFLKFLGDLIRQSSPEKSISNNGKINYGFNRSSPDEDFERKHPDQFSTSSTNDSDDMTVDDFGDVVKRRKSSSHSSSNKSSHHRWDFLYKICSTQ